MDSRIPVVAAIILFIILHRRHLRKQREEDNDDRHASLDFGMGDVPQPGRAKKRPMPGMLETNFGEKSAHRHNQMSMDLGMTSPYLLPPELQSSRESLHSLSRTIHQNEDPYRPVTQYYPGDGASIRSQSRQGPDGASIYTSSSKAASKFQDGTEGLLANAARMSRSSPPVATAFIPPPRQNSLPQKNPSVNTVEVNAGDSTPQSPPPYPVEPPQAHIHESSIPGNGSPAGPLPDHGLAPALNTSMDGRASYASSGDAGLRQSNNYLGSIIEAQDPSAPDNTAERGAALTSERSPLPANPQPIRKQSLNILQSSHQSLSGEVDEIGDGFKVTPPSPGLEKDAEHTRGQRQSMSAAPEEFAHAGLNAPALDPRRLSMGLRPLPPDAVTEVDDPEVRANRIRSFYKEYFDESKPAPEGQYHEDYDENYLGDAAYFDPDSNNFVMPYAQPVTRRAMTPPPSGPRFQGARMPGPRFQGPPRAMHGSMGGMSSISGMRGPQGPRAFSSASGRMGPPRKPMPPPAALTTLPTPSKLRDDTLAIMNPLDFAPPQTFRDRVAGRSESPLGERRPYSPAVPSFVPVVSAFDELAPIPSP